MTKRKLPPAKDWQARNIEDWNVVSVTEYLKDKHRELFGIDYAPHGGRWALEQGILGTLIGTQSRTNPKSRTASNEDVKRFIDETFAQYKPSAQYPGTSFGFMWTYRKNVWQRIQAESMRKAEAEQKREEQADDWNDIADWL